MENPVMSSLNLAALTETFREHREQFINEWREFLTFPSISADPRHDADCRRCAEWLVKHLKKIGFDEASLIETEGKPLVYAKRAGKAGPRVSFYGHYDVQPVDPLNLWGTPPFEPQLREGRLYARGAQDNKGQLFYFLKAVEVLIKKNALNVPLSLFIEGEEESSSIGITRAIPSLREKLSSDILMVCDTGTERVDAPTVTMGLRGIVFLTATLKGITKDLHSGHHGGLAPNPATELARLVATLHDGTGKIAVADFYEGVQAVTDADRKLLATGHFDEKVYREQIGVPPVGGEKGIAPAERRGFRPTIEINGFHSGYDGPGSKTIIPASAYTKITARLVGKQDPKLSLERIIKHLEAHAPKGLTLEISESGVGGPAFLANAGSPVIAKAKAVLDELSGGKTVFSWEGGSIPVVASLAIAAGAEPLLVGYGLEEDNIHAPNESFSLQQFEQGFLYAGLFLSRLA
jgi:acetylornithine deacetylase/succinyl-diaminopimelate desuccinylase-like protein